MKRLSFLPFCLAALVASAFAGPSVRVEVDASQPGKPIPDDFLGLSYESLWLRPDQDGGYYFNADDKPLVALFRTLGVKSLRVGGNSVDRVERGEPTTADADRLFEFARSAGVRVIYTFRLWDGSPDASAKMAAHIAKNYRDNLTAFAVGNEPNVFMKDYPAFRDLWKKHRDAVLAIAPSAKFCGPAPTLGKVGWIANFVNDFAASGSLAFVTQHFYPGGSAAKVVDPARARAAMLSPQWPQDYVRLLGAFAPVLEAGKIPYRIEESNSFWNAGAVGASDTFAASLWALDYLGWWAGHGAAGVNFHTGDTAMISNRVVPCIYAAFWKSGIGYQARPIAYAMAAFKEGRGDRLVTVRFKANRENLNVTAYGMLGTDRTLRVIVINKENGTSAREAAVELQVGSGYSSFETMALVAPRNDLAATDGITLGGAAIEKDGSWRGRWSAPRTIEKPLVVTVPTCSAMLLKIK